MVLHESHVMLTSTNGVSPNHLQRQTMNHIVDTCPLTKFEGGLNLLHEADDDAVPVPYVGLVTLLCKRK